MFVIDREVQSIPDRMLVIVVDEVHIRSAKLVKGMEYVICKDLAKK